MYSNQLSSLSFLCFHLDSSLWISVLLHLRYKQNTVKQHNKVIHLILAVLTGSCVQNAFWSGQFQGRGSSPIRKKYCLLEITIITLKTYNICRVIILIQVISPIYYTSLRLYLFLNCLLLCLKLMGYFLEGWEGEIYF